MSWWAGYSLTIEYYEYVNPIFQWELSRKVTFRIFLLKFISEISQKRLCANSCHSSDNSALNRQKMYIIVVPPTILSGAVIARPIFFKKIFIVRIRYGVSFVNLILDLYSVPLNAVMCVKLCYFGPHYNGNHLYLGVIREKTYFMTKLHNIKTMEYIIDVRMTTKLPSNLIVHHFP